MAHTDLQNISLILKDFSDSRKPRYKAAHVYCIDGWLDILMWSAAAHITSACKEAQLTELASLGKALKTLKEVPLSFLPKESGVSRC